MKYSKTELQCLSFSDLYALKKCVDIEIEFWEDINSELPINKQDQEILQQYGLIEDIVNDELKNRFNKIFQLQ